MIAFLYARVSTGEQNEGMQLREMLELCQRKNWTPEVFTDHGVSGAKSQRPELGRMMALVRRGKCDVVMVYRFDRFARSTQHLLHALDEFRALNVQFVSVHEQIDTSTALGKVIFTVIAAIAEFERELIRERVKSGIAQARARGVRLGRPQSYVTDDEILALRAQGLSLRAIGQQLGLSHPSVMRALKRAENAVQNPGA